MRASNRYYLGGLTLRAVVGAAAGVVARLHEVRLLVLRHFRLANHQEAAERVGQISLTWGSLVRERYYRRVLEVCGPGLVVGGGATIGNRRTHVGANVLIGSNSFIDFAHIGDDVLIAMHVCVLAGGRQHGIHQRDLPIRSLGRGEALRPTRIGAGAWIGANAVVMADVGEGAVVGAAAVVTRPIPSFAVAVGNPARVISWRQGETPLPTPS